MLKNKTSAQGGQKKKEVENKKSSLINVLTAEQLVEYIRFARSPWKTFIFNFLRGTAYGLGFILGTGIVLSLLIFISSYFIDYPVIGEWLGSLGKFIESSRY